MDLKIRERREAMGLTQTELAQKVGKSFRTIQSWERGESYPNAEYVVALCNTFGVEPNELLCWYDDHPRQPKSSTPEHEELTGYFDQCTPERRERLLKDAQEKAMLSRDFRE